MNKLTKTIADAAHTIVAVVTGNPEQTPAARAAATRKTQRAAAKQADAAVVAKRISDDTQAHIDAAAAKTVRKTGQAAHMVIKPTAPGVVDHGPSNKAIADMLQREATNLGINLDDVHTKLKAAEGKVAPAIPTTGYTGPMRALRDRVKAGAYTKAANGQPSCGDDVAQILGTLEPVEVIKACMVAMDLDTNPYPHLNIGQQSMNLRNKLRGQLKRGEIGMGVVREAVEVVMEARPPKAPAEAGTPARLEEIKAEIKANDDKAAEQAAPVPTKPKQPRARKAKSGMEPI